MSIRNVFRTSGGKYTSHKILLFQPPAECVAGEKFKFLNTNLRCCLDRLDIAGRIGVKRKEIKARSYPAKESAIAFADVAVESPGGLEDTVDQRLALAPQPVSPHDVEILLHGAEIVLRPVDIDACGTKGGNVEFFGER